VGRVTHCGDAAADWRGALPSTRVDEEESASVEEELEAMTAEPQQVIQFQSLSCERVSEAPKAAKCVKFLFGFLWVY
jgi:hypothetical protein